MLGLAAITLPALLAASASSTISFELRLRVPVVCSIESLASSPDDPRSLRISTSCNAENLSLSFGGDLADNRIAQVNTASFSTNYGASNVSLRQFRPGRGEVEIVFDEEIGNFSNNSVSLFGY